MKRWLVIGALTIAAICVFRAFTPSAEPATIAVGAGAGLSDVFEILTGNLESTRSLRVTCNLAGAGVLASQVRQGSGLDVVVFPAGGGHMDQLEREGFILRETRREVARDTLILAVELDRAVPQDPWTWLTTSSVSRLAVGDPKMVPVGHYSYQVMDNLGIKELLEPKMILTRTVRQALIYLEQGEVDAAIVFESTIKGSDRVKAIAEAPEGSHEPVVFEAAVVTASQSREEAEEFISYLTSPEAARLFSQYGFDTER